jgi:putative tryptophan/tyrosine transport system substrate-binding protein
VKGPSVEGQVEGGRENHMKKKITVLTLSAMLFALCSSAQAQQPAGKIPRIGFLSRELHPSDSRAGDTRRLEFFREGLRELGYVEGKNLIIEYRYAEGRPERLPALAEELVRLKVDIIVTDTAAPARAARKATSTIPIVMVSAGNPIQAGLVASLARPGGNVTGLTGLTVELLGKRFELLKEVVPKVTRFAFLDDDDIVDLSPFKYAQEAAQALSSRLDRIEVKTANPDFDGAFRMMAKERVGAVITSAGFLSTTLHRKKILELLEQARLPAIHGSTPMVTDGGLMYYGVNSSDLYRRAATFVDKILKGTKPADLPVEQPTKFEFIVNLKAAKKIGLTVPPNVLARADKVLK